jgi:hypothetical protein
LKELAAPVRKTPESFFHTYDWNQIADRAAQTIQSIMGA